MQYAASADKALNKNKAPWNISVRTVDDYIRRAKQNVEKAMLPKREFLIRQAHYRFNDCYMQLYGLQDYKSAGDIQSKINRLAGLDAPDDLNVTSSLTLTLSMSDLHDSMEGVKKEKDESK